MYSSVGKSYVSKWKKSVLKPGMLARWLTFLTKWEKVMAGNETLTCWPECGTKQYGQEVYVVTEKEKIESRTRVVFFSLFHCKQSPTDT